MSRPVNADRIASRVLAGEAFTWRIADGETPHRGFAVVLPGGPILYGDHEFDEVAEVCERLLVWAEQVGVRHVGGWLRPDGGYTLDAVRVFGTLAGAMTAARMDGQAAVYDLRTGADLATFDYDWLPGVSV